MRTVLLAFHLLGATIWTGGHLVLALTVLPRAMRAKDATIVHSFEEGFERVGIPALLVQIVTGIWMALQWLPSPAQWFDLNNSLARGILLKLSILLLTVILAAHARLRVLPTLTNDRLGALAAHIIPVTILSVLFVLLGESFRFGGV